MVNYPQDWEENELGNLAFIKTGSKNNEDKVSGGKYPFYVRSEKVERINTFSYDTEAILVPGEGNIGSVFHYVNGKFDVHQRVYAITNFRDTLNAKYLYWFMVKNFGSYALSQTSKATVDSLRLPAFKNFCVVIPPFPEQQAIADALTAFNTHISNLSKLIEKKKMIRDGAVEDLVSGKRRLEGFSGKWKEAKLEDICVENGLVRGPFGGSLKKEYFVSKGYKVYEQKNAIYGNVNIGSYYIDDQKFEELKRFELNRDDFIVSCSGTIGKIYRMPCNFEKGIINQALLKITLDSAKCNLDFFNTYFKWQKFQMKIIDDTQGGAMKNLVGMDKFKRTMLYIPTSLPEQQAIADILTAMDKEIADLEQEKEKYIALKAGAMDDLLIGKIRLV